MTRRRLARAACCALGIAAASLCAGARAESTKLTGDVLLQADEVIYDADTQIVSAHGHVEVDYGQRMLMAETLSYDQTTDTMTASGHVSILDEKGNVAFADHVRLTDKMRDGALEGFGALIGKSGRLAAASARRTGGRLTEAFDATYTPCKICRTPGQRTPVWRVKAYRVVYDELKHRIRFNHARLEFFGVPVLYTPYLSEPDPSVKYASGLLMPDIGSSTSIGYFVRLPIYISLSPSSDATIAPLFTTGGGEMLEGEYRERYDDGGMWLQASVAYNPHGLPSVGGLPRTPDRLYGHLFGSGRIPIAANWRTGYDIQLTSDSKYLKAYDISQLDRLNNDLFIEGTSGRSRFAITGYFFQGLRVASCPTVGPCLPADNNRTFPIPLPLIEYSYVPENKIAGGQFRFDVNAVALSRDSSTIALGSPLLSTPSGCVTVSSLSVRCTSDQRVSATLRWRAPFVTGDGQLITFQVSARGDVYHIQDPLVIGSANHFISRGLPYAALDWRWPFIASTGGGRSMLIEPIAQLIAAPYGGNPKALIALNEDSTSLELDENNLFSFDQLPGYDLVESGPRANFGVRAQARFDSGVIEALLGESFRLKPDPLFASDPALRGTSSDIVGRFSIKFPPYLDLTHRIDIDDQTGTVRRNEVYLTGSYGRSSLQVSYAQLAASALTLGLPARQEVNAQADVNFYENWQAFAAVRRDLDAGQMLDSEYGLGYEDECFGMALAYRRRYTSQLGLPPSTSVILRLKLKSGNEAIEPFSLFPQDVFSNNRP